MKRVYSSWYVKILSFCLILLGFNSCTNNDGIGEMPAEYGSPSARYKVIGKVVAAEEPKEPVRGIRVVFSRVDENGVFIRPELCDTVFTDTNGTFEIDHWGFPTNNFLVVFEDVDGPENGSFIDKEEMIQIRSEEYEGGGSWYKGVATVDMGTIELVPKEEVEEPEPDESDDEE